MQQYSYTVRDRFMRYVQIDTQSDPHSHSFPSTEKQKDLSLLLVNELKQMGISDAHLDEWGYVMATIPATIPENVPVICFCAHVDTAPDCTGTGVKPILHPNYQGQDIILPDDTTQIVSPAKYPYLQQKIGDDLITASGTTLLGADDKAGVAIIMDFAHFLMTNQGCKHGPIRLLFTPDEEVGRGTEKLDIKKLGASFGYTLDGGELGSLEYETFSANAVSIRFMGVIAHPGYAKGILVNAIKIASHFVEQLPKQSLSPETTAGREGFVHPVHVSGNADQSVVEFIIRDFDTDELKVKQDFLYELAKSVCAQFPGSSFDFVVTEQYRNMKEIVDAHPHVVELAKRAIEKTGLKVKTESVRGGTDGSRLSFLGLPCPNLFAGENAIHSKHEFVSVQDMQKSVQTLVNLVTIAAQRSADS
ncbi:MAG TPA: peptidase T [Chitinophagaceae bacterium]|nr:peptidase T [Chitinophagia bacterium]HAL94961.1 peptidase T [Chitinophagaceae bacterium]